MSKKLGPPTTGLVIGIEKMPEVNPFNPLWSRLYPDSKLIVKVRVPQPIKALSFDEYCELFPEATHEPDPLLAYLNRVMYVRELYYPVEDLEELDP